MPLVGFSLIFVGGLLAYSGYLGQTPLTVVKFVFSGKKLPDRLPLNPNDQQGSSTSSAAGSGGGVINA